MTGLGASGVWQVTTVSSTYLIDLDALTAFRVPDAGAGSLPDDPLIWAPALLRRDHEPVDILAIDRCELGERMRLWVDVRGDGVPTFRDTTPVTAIRRLNRQQTS